jgi:gluconolactonase
LVTSNLNGPNGIAFSPDEKYLYVTNWDAKKKVIMR